MINKLFGAMCAVVFGAGICTAQSSGSQTITNWGESIQGVQLSIMITNSVLDTNSTITLVAVIKNSSKNAIDLPYTGQPADYDVILRNSSSRMYHLIRMPVTSLNTTVTVKPGEQDVRSILVALGPISARGIIAPGDYTLQATRWFTVETNEFKLVSNSLKVRLK